MQNILYIGPYKDSNGYGYSSRRYIDCLSSNDNLNLSIRPIFTNTSYINNPLNTDKYIEYENNSSKFYDIVIQHCYPDFFAYDKRFGKNIGVCQIETKNLQKSGWIDKINLMDEIWVGSLFAKDSLLEANKITCDIRVVPEPYDINKYSNKDLSQFFDFQTKDKPFIFYTIGQYSDKKNIKNIILAFLLEFNKEDNVRLFIKTGDYNTNPKDLENIIRYDMNQIKLSIRKPDTPDIDIITGILKDIDILRLHSSADCYVNAVKSDDGGGCAIEAKLMDKIVINTKNIGSGCYLNSMNSLLVESIPSYVFSNDISNHAIFTPNELWLEPDIDSLRQSMRKAFFMNNDDKLLLCENFNKNIFDKNIISNKIL